MPHLLKPRFLEIKKDVIKLLGDDALTGDVVQKFGKKTFGKNWGGVNAVDNMPTLKKGKYYIINTGKFDGAGMHWMAMYCDNDKTVHIWDSFGRNINKLIPIELNKLKGTGYKIAETPYHPTAQHSQSKLCGQMSLSWLILLNELLCENPAITPA